MVGVGNYGQQGLGSGVMILNVKRVDEETSEGGLDGEGNERSRIVVKAEVPDARSSPSSARDRLKPERGCDFGR